MAILLVILFRVFFKSFQRDRGNSSEPDLINIVTCPRGIVNFQTKKDNDQTKSVNINDLVVGDIVKCEIGKIIPVDALIIEAENLEVEEPHCSCCIGACKCAKSALKAKYEDCSKLYISLKNPNPADLKKENEISSPVLLAGSKVVRGAGFYMVITVGNLRSQQVLEINPEELTPLQKNIKETGDCNKKISWVISFIIFAILAIRAIVIRNKKADWDKTDISLLYSYLVLLGILMFVSMPEILTYLIPIALPNVLMGILRNDILVKDLTAIERLATITDLITQKNDILTKNETTIADLYFIQKNYPTLENPASSIASIPVSDKNKLFEVLSYLIPKETKNELEKGMLEFLEKCGSNQKKIIEDTKAEIIHTIPFNSLRARTSVIVRYPNNEDYLYVFGAGERIMNLSSKIYLENGKEEEMNVEIKAKLQEYMDSCEKKGYRNIGFAMKKLAPNEGGADHQEEINENFYEIEKSGIVFLCLFGTTNLMRKGADEIISSIKSKHGIIVRMFTGGTKSDSMQIAKKCGILKNENSPDSIMDGSAFSTRIKGKANLCPKCNNINSQNLMAIPENAGKEACVKCGSKLKKGVADMAEFMKLAPNLQVLYRATPEEKLLLVSALKFMGHGVSMIGINGADAPSTKLADVGIAMEDATDIQKSASSMILLNNNLAAVEKAISWGKHLYLLIRQYLIFQLTMIFVTLALYLLSSVTIFGYVITPAQLLVAYFIVFPFSFFVISNEELHEDNIIPKLESILNTVLFIFLYNLKECFD